MAASVSESVVDTYIAIWRTARLARGESKGWPSCSILGRVVEMGPNAASARIRGGRIPPDYQDDRDAIFVQALVDQMFPEIRASFESFHVGVIRGDSCRHLPQKARALILGIDRSTYYERVEFGKDFLARRIGEVLDFADTFA